MMKASHYWLFLKLVDAAWDRPIAQVEVIRAASPARWRIDARRGKAGVFALWRVKGHQKRYEL
jgi:hypothetical protein